MTEASSPGSSPVSAVCDAGPLIHLDQLGCLDLLGGFAGVAIPEAVWHEVARNRATALAAPFLRRATTLPLSDPQAAALCVAFSLDAGETECLALLASDARALFLTDDAAARLVAERLGYSVHGTIGVLTRSIRTGSRTATQVLQLLDELPTKSTLFIRRSLLAEVIDTVRRSTRR